MKRMLVLLICAFFLLALTGCWGPARYNMSPGSVEVFVEGDGEFPEFLVGKWEGDKKGWGFVFEPDGKISVARIAMGRTKIIPGKITTLETWGGGTSGITSGNVTFSNGSANSGNYEARLFFNNSYKAEAAAEFTVASPPLPPVEKEKSKANLEFGMASPPQPSVETDNPVYEVNEAIVVNFSNAAGNAWDWIGLYEKGAANDAPIDWFYTDGRKSGEAVYIPGDWLVQYSPDDRELIVVAVMNYIRVDWLDGVFQGKTKYILIGNVSEDGQMWQTTVYSFPEYEGFPVDPNDLPYTEEVNFVKVAGEI